MKIGEMISAICKDPSLKFVNDDNKLVFAKADPFCIGFIDHCSKFWLLDMCEMDLRSNWQLVREPTDFMTAVNSGRKVKSERWSRFYPLSEVYGILGACPLDAIDVINGKWYIE